MAGLIRALLLILVIGVIVLIAGFEFGFLDVSQTRTAELPKIRLEGGQAPVFSVKTPEVSISSTATKVDVPKVAVGTTEKTVQVPSIDVSKAR